MKRFTYPTMREARAEVLKEYGDQAVIIKSEENEHGAVILATSCEQAESLNLLQQKPKNSVPKLDFGAPREATIIKAAEAKAEVAQPVPGARSDMPKEQVVLTPPLNLIEAAEIHAKIDRMELMMRRQMGMLSWKEQVHRNPVRGDVWRAFTECGFSPLFARTAVEAMDKDMSTAQAPEWMENLLFTNLPIKNGDEEIMDKGGVVAIVGPTGVGKTTSIAKIASRLVAKHGSGSLGMITTDNFRIGAKDQLNIYGKILDVPVYTARTKDDVDQLIESMGNKKLILIDTVGIGQNDPTMPSVVSILENPKIRKWLLLNTASQSESIEEVANAYRQIGLDGVILGKIDEAVRIGASLDVCIRNALPIVYMSMGQRVPEDFFVPDAEYLVGRSLSQRVIGAFSMTSDELQWKFDRVTNIDRDLLGKLQKSA